jgi:hypothetical protein
LDDQFSNRSKAFCGLYVVPFVHIAAVPIALVLTCFTFFFADTLAATSVTWKP